MSSEGPTTVGSINARLTLDASEFDRDMRQAGELADRLDGRNVDVHVHANTTEAIAGLKELELAENRLRIAQLNLNDVNSRAGATEQQQLRARNALIQAEDRYDRALTARERAVRDATQAEHESTDAAEAGVAAADRHVAASGRVQIATDRVRLAQMRLDEVNANANATERQRLQAQLGLTSAQDALARATDNTTEAQKGQFSWMQALIAATPLLLAGTAELAAATVGLGTAFVAEGAAGALAIKGIKDAMQQGTATGNAYADGITHLQSDLSQLSQTAAVNMLDGFNHAVGSLNGSMPFLNQLTGEMASQLGRIGGNLLADVLTGLKTMMPLIQAGASALGDFVGWLGHFTSENGFQQFVNYAVSTLPQVMGFLQDVVTLAGRLIGAFAPLGPVVVGALDLLVNVLNAFPLPVLAGIATLAVTIAPAFAIARTAVALFGETAALQALNVTLFGTAINLAVPVVGILVAALAGLGMALATSAAGQQSATVSANEYADALERDGNKIGEYTTKLAVKKMAEAGGYDAVSKLGLGQDTLTRALTGNSDALRVIQDRINEVNGAYDTAAKNSSVSGLKIAKSILEQKGAADQLGPVLNANIAAILQQQHVNELAAAATADSSQAARDKVQADMEGAAAMGVSVKAYQDATAAQSDADQKTRDTTLAMQLQNDAAGILKGTLDALNGKSLSAAQAQNAFDSSLTNMGTHVDKTGKQITFTTSSINDMSSASVALRGQLNGQISNLQAVVEANGGLANSTGAAREQMVTMRQQIIDNAVAHGVDRDAVTAYIDKILQIPASVPPTKFDADTHAALTAIAILQNAIAGIHDKTVTISTVNVGDASTSVGSSGGGLVHAYAQGGWAGTGPAYFAAGGDASRYARGTDTIPSMLSPGEFTVRASAASRLPAGALEHINRTGQLPQQGMGPVTLVAYITNPFTGEQVRATVAAVADDRIDRAARDAANLSTTAFA